jgi:LacI family transcriptional regulator
MAPKTTKKEVTIYDIAQELSISSATVSRALQNHPAVNSNTRKRIQEAAVLMGYRHNRFASSLRKQKTHTIGVLVHELKSNFITSVLAGIEKVTTEAGYDIIIAHSSERYEKEAANAENLFHKRVDGLIASLAFDTKNLHHYQPYYDKGIPVIFFDRVEEQMEGTKVIIDNLKCGEEATRHLIEQGCRRIVLVTGNLSRNVYHLRHEGYKKALHEAGIPYDPNHVLIKDLSEAGGVEAAQQVMQMDPLPDGIFITNDFSAAVCMQTLKSFGLRIPEDMAIVGFNNDVISKIVEPQLTTIHYPGSHMGETAARSLINHLEGVSLVHHTQTIVVRSELVIRPSSLKNKNKEILTPSMLIS